ncbi:MAG: hypothetical protein H5T62_17615 [Anaerolineae bacterium]|nr:hypothetical protein [Anaerolineae bacterium]
MDSLTLEPYAARLRWRFPQEQTLQKWQTLLANFLDELGRACVTSGPYVIGHIKAIALLPGGGFLRGSKVSARYPADTECTGQDPDRYAELDMTLNVLVYGPSWTETHRLVSEVGLALAQRWGAELSISIADSEHHYHHH